MATSLGKVMPFVTVNRTAEVYGLTNYPVGNIDPAAPGSNQQGPLLGTNYINILNLRDYYNLPYPPVTPLASPPVIGIVSFGGGIYGQPVSSGKYSGFWKCTDISGSNGAPIQILVAPINGAINAPNADDGGATLENTVDVATVNAFYGMINQGRDAPVYTPPVIILYIAPSDDMEEVYKTFYTVLKNPVVCNGHSYLPSVVCCSWGAPEIAWTQKMAFPPSGLAKDINNDPNPTGIAIMNEINDLFADATRRGINICVASGVIDLPRDNLETSNQSQLAKPQIMFPASSPYVTCVGGSSVFFPNGPTRNFNNPGEFAWARAEGGVSGAFPIPDYQSNLPGSALVSANAFLASSRATSLLLEESLGAANVSDASGSDLSGVTINTSFSSITKNEIFEMAEIAYKNAAAAYKYAKDTGGSDAATLQLQQAMNVAHTALTAAKENAMIASNALSYAQDAVVKAAALETLINQAAIAYNVATVNEMNNVPVDPCSNTTQLDEIARDAALVVFNGAVSQAAASIFAPQIVSDLTSNVTTAVTSAQDILAQLVNPYDPVNSVEATAVVPLNLRAIYKGEANTYPAKDKLTKLVADAAKILSDVLMVDSSGAYSECMNLYEDAVSGLDISGNVVSLVVATAAEAARLAKTVNDNTTAFLYSIEEWKDANDEFNKKTEKWNYVSSAVPALSQDELDTARANLTAANDVLTAKSVLLADAGAANLLAANKLKSITAESLSNVSSQAYDSLFEGSDALTAAISDASGADIFTRVLQLSAANSVIVKLNEIALVADNDASEARRCYSVWSDAVAAVNVANSANLATARNAVVVASEAMRVAAVRAASSMNAVSVLLNNTNIGAAISPWNYSATATAVATALTDANASVTAVNNGILANPLGMSGSPSSYTVPLTDLYITSVYGSSTGTIHQAVVAVRNIMAEMTNENRDTTNKSAGKLNTNVSDMVVAVFNAEGSIIYSAYTLESLDQIVCDYTAGLSAFDAIYDEFNALNIAAKKAYDLSVLALEAANLAHARVNIPSISAIISNSSMFDAARLSTAAANAVIDYNNLVYNYSSITPSLIDAAVRSQLAIYKAAESTNLATAASNPTPVTPQMVKTLQGLVLKAKASTQLALESNPTNANLRTTLALWNTAVSTGADALVGIAGTTDPNPDTPENEALRQLFKDFANNNVNEGPLGAIQLAYNNGTKNSSYNFSPNSAMYLSGKAAYDFATTYFSIGRNGGNLAYVMTVANNAIVTAWNAAQASNVAGSNTARIAAQANWETAANRIAQVIQAGGFNTLLDIDLPTDLRDAVFTAYQKTTGLTESGVPATSAIVDAASDSVRTTDAYITAVAAYKAFMVAFNSYNTDFLGTLEKYSTDAAVEKNNAKIAIALAIAAAARTNTATKKSAEESNALAISTQTIDDQASLAAAEAAYAAADNVNMYRCIPDVAMHADVDDLPIVFRLNGGNVYVGGTSVAAAMFAGFLGVVQSHNPINYFMNPVLYNHFTYPSPLFYDISGTDELLNPSSVTSRYNWVIKNELDKIDPDLDTMGKIDPIHGSYNSRVGLGSIRADTLSAFLEAPELVTNMVTGPYPKQPGYVYIPNPPARAAIQTVSVYPGTTSDIYVFVGPSSAYNTNVSWSCSSPYNATVTQTLEVYKEEDISPEGSPPGSIMAMVYRAKVTGVVPVDPLAPVPVITIASTDGSNVFTTINVNVLPALQVTGVSISSVGETKNPANTVLSLGKTLQLIATVTPQSATNKTVYWWSSNMSIVNVDVNGLLTPLAPGNVTIKATSVNNNISASISVYVPTPMTGVSASPSMITLNPNMLVYPLKNTQLIKALVTPDNADYKKLTWSIVSSQPLALPAGTTDQLGTPLFYSGDNKVTTPVISLPSPNGIVLKRDSNGKIVDNTQDLVTAVSNGTAMINVSTANASDSVYGTYSANILVNVVTPITNVTLTQTNMVINLNPQSAVRAVNPSVDVQYGSQYGTTNQNWTLPVYNADVPDRNLDDSYKVTATLFPAFPSNMNLIWTSSNPKVAIVSNNTPPVLNKTASDPNFDLFQITEMITPLANGSTVIKVTTADGAKVAMVNVVVTTPVTNIALSPMPITLNPGAQYALQATVLPTTASNAGLVWDTTNSAVATVDQNGVVTAVASGSCGISVSTVDGDYMAMATMNVVTPLVGVSLVLNTPTPIHVGSMVQILVVMTPTTASNQEFTWTVTNGINGSIFTNGPAQNGNIVYLDAARAGSAVFTVTTKDGNKQANLALTVVNY